MKFSIAATLVALSLLKSVASDTCACDPMEYHDEIGMKATKVGNVPIYSNEAFNYNMFVSDNFDDDLFFLDQYQGIIYAYDENDQSVTEIFNVKTSTIPDGLSFDFPECAKMAQNKVFSMAQGRDSEEVYIVFQSGTLPSGWTEPDVKLPPPGAFPFYACATEGEGENYIVNGENATATFIRDVYRIDPLPSCIYNFGGCPTPIVYLSFYKYKYSNGVLSNPEPFFAYESLAISGGHHGGGMATVKTSCALPTPPPSKKKSNPNRKDTERNTKKTPAPSSSPSQSQTKKTTQPPEPIDPVILWAVGDHLIFGTNGLYAPQLDHEINAKILAIYPGEVGKYKTVAKGIRNSQQFRVVDDMLVFMDIGGVTAEEVNAIGVCDLFKSEDKTPIPNFGWGINLKDGKAREGTFYVGPGTIGVLGTEPPCEEDAPTPEPGFIQPWIQFGRNPEDMFYGVSGFAVKATTFDRLKLIYTEFNTGAVLGTDEDFTGSVSTGYKINLYNEDGDILENGFNDLVYAELGEVFYYRGDPRLFHFPDGTAGVFIERTGAFYALEEIAITA